MPGRKRWERTQKARCCPPVWKRARLYAISVPTATESTVVADAMIRLLISPCIPRYEYKAAV